MARDGSTWGVRVLGGTVALLLLAIASAAGALEAGQGMQLQNGCMQDIAKFGLQCTAEDVKVARAMNVDIIDPCSYPGDTVTFTATFEVVLTAQARHDVGIYFATDGDPNHDGAVAGQCSVNTVPYDPDPPWLDLDGTTDPLAGTNKPSGVQDLCGDIDANHNPLYPRITLTTVCIDTDGDGQLNLPYCTSWRQPGSNVLCTSPLEAFPGSPSKCKCDVGFNVPVPVPPQNLQVVKTASPTTVNEPGGTVTFSVQVFNPSTFMGVTLTSLQDSIYGDVTHAGGKIISTTCALPHSLATSDGAYGGADTLECAFTATVVGEPGSETDTITATGVDDKGRTVSGMDDATVAIADVASSLTLEKAALQPQVQEPGGTVTFTVKVTNTSLTDTVTIDTLVDDLHGNLQGQGDCAAGAVLVPGAAYVCSFTAYVSGEPRYTETDVVTATGTDDEGKAVTASDSAIVEIVDVPSSITVTKTATPDQFDEPGAMVRFTFTVTNTSAVDTVTIDSLLDVPLPGLPQGANVLSECAGAAAVVLPPGGSFTCSILRFIAGNAGDQPSDEVTASGTDDEGNPLSAKATEVLTLVDVLPAVSIVKTADPISVPETGGPVQFQVVISSQTRAEPIELTSLVDSIHGDLSAACGLPRWIEPLGSPLNGDGTDPSTWTCTFTRTLAGKTGTSETDVVTVTAADDDGNSVTAFDDATVTFTNVLPHVAVTKTADPAHVLATGGDVTFTFVVSNVGAVPVTLTRLEDSVFGDLLDLALNPTSTCAKDAAIAAGAAYTCAVTKRLASQDLADHVDVVTARATDEDGSWDEAQATATVTFDDPRISLVKTATETEFDAAGDVLHYTLVATNTGNVTLTNVAIGDPKLGALTCTPAQPATLAPAAALSCTGSYTVTQADVDAGKVDNLGTARGTFGGKEYTATDPETVTGIVNPHITLVKTAAETEYRAAGDVLHYTLVATNDGNVTLTSVTVGDPKLGTLACTPAQPAALAPAAALSCTGSYTVTQSDVDAGKVLNSALATGTPPSGPPVTDGDGHEVPAIQNPLLALVKTTNGADGDFIPMGAGVSWVYVATNIGNVTLSNVLVTDDQGVSVWCPTTALAVGESMTCTASGTAVAGAYHNIGTVTAKAPLGQDVGASDPSSYFGSNPSIAIQKTTNGADGAYIPMGAPITWTYVVANTGNVALTGVAVTDDELGAIACPQAALAVGESMTCTATGTAVEGRYDNVGTATGSPPVGGAVSASDASWYFGSKPSIAIDKTTNGSDGPFILAGAAVTWRYLVTNTGNVALTGVAVTDDKLGAIACPKAVLAVGESMTCTASGVAIAGAYGNLGTATGTPPVGASVSASDPSSYFGAVPALTLDKVASPKDYSIQGALITYSYVVTNSGNVDVAGPFTVTDDRATASCPASPTFLTPGQSITCTASYPISAADMTAGSVTNTAQAHGFYGGLPVSSNLDSETVLEVAQTGRILPTQTTCQDFRDGTFTDLELMYYLVSKGAIGSVSPGVLFYYSKVQLAGDSILVVVPQQNSAGWNPFLPQDVNQVVLWDAACNKASGTITPSFDAQGVVTVQASGIAAGTYYLSVKYAAGTIVGQAVSRPYPTVTYGFSTWVGGDLLIHSLDAVTLLPKK